MLKVKEEVLQHKAGLLTKAQNHLIHNSLKKSSLKCNLIKNFIVNINRYI